MQEPRQWLREAEMISLGLATLLNCVVGASSQSEHMVESFHFSCGDTSGF